MKDIKDWKKVTKLAVLLISSLLISMASASIINELTMTATVGITTPDIVFWQGADWDAVGGSMGAANQSVTFSSMNGKNGSLTTYTEPVLIKNKGSSNYNLTLTLYSTSTIPNTLRYVNITMYDGTTPKGNSIIILSSGPQSSSSGEQIIPTGASWRVQWDICWWNNVTGSESFTVTLKLYAEKAD